MWPVPAPAAVHQCGFPLLSHPSVRTGAATRPGVSEREQFFLAAVAQNIKRLVRFLSQPTTPSVETAS